MGDHDPSGESLELMTEQLDRIRSHLDRCHSQQQGRIDYHAVLLVHLRWFLSEPCARRSIRGSTQGWAIVPNWWSTVFPGGLPKASDDSSRGGR